MVEIILVVMALGVLLMYGSKLNKALDWTGDRIAQSGDIVDHLSSSAVKQTARAVIISNDSLDSTKLESLEKKKDYALKRKEFFSKLTKEETKQLDSHEEWLSKF